MPARKKTWRETLLDDVIRIDSRDRPVEALPGYADGQWWVQDLAASLPARLIWGDPDGVERMVQPFLDAGLDGLIFNMPAGSSPEDVELAGRTLTERFADT